MKPVCRRLGFVCIFLLLAPHVAFANEPVEQTGNAYESVLLVVYVAFALVVSFVCSVAESVLLCITPSYIESIRPNHPSLGRLLRRLRMTKVNESFAAILSLNTIAHTMGAVWAGAQAKAIFGSAWVGVFSAVMTLLILFLSEIIPKTIGAVYWKQLASVTAFAIQAMIYLLYPIVWLSEKLTKRIGHGSTAHILSRDEMVAMAELGSQEGHVDQHESRIFQNLFQLSTLTASDIMTPRVVISALPQNMTVAEALKISECGPFSRLPVYEWDLDHITGFVLKDQILLLAAKGETETRLETIKRDIPVVPETVSLSKLLDDMLKLRQHIAVVVDEYGGTAGLVSMEDAVETLLGIEIKDEMDSVEDMRHLARQKWETRARELGVDMDKAIVEDKSNSG